MALNTDDLDVSGWVCRPRSARSTSRGIYVFVNGRYVKDRVIQHALFAGFGSRLMKGRFPLAVVSITVPPDQVDVNVHPTKHEVRFVRQRKVHDGVSQAVAQALSRVDQAKWTARDTRPEDPPVRHRPPVAPPMQRYMEADHVRSAVHSHRIAEKAPADRRPTADGPAGQPPDPDPKPAPLASPAPTNHASSRVPDPQPQLWEKAFFKDLRVIGQFRGTYILCEARDEGLILIDQHAAHERVVFEQLKKRLNAADPAVQRLLMPETIELGFREAGVLERLIPALAATGLDIEPFGGNTFVVKAVPAMLSGRDVRPLVTELVEKAVETGVAAGAEKTLDACLEIMACHGAIRANQALSDRQIKALLVQLDACENPSNCPHGRPTWIRWSVKFLEKAFNRIV